MGICSTLMLLNLIRRIFWLCHNEISKGQVSFCKYLYQMEAIEQGVPTLHTTGSNHSLSLASVTA